MSAVLPVFAGLGSPSLFSDETVHGAAQDALLPECAMLLQFCHRTFHTQIFEAVTRGILAADVINLDDFNEPITLARPPIQLCTSAGSVGLGDVHIRCPMEHGTLLPVSWASTARHDISAQDPYSRSALIIPCTRVCSFGLITSGNKCQNGRDKA